MALRGHAQKVGLAGEILSWHTSTTVVRTTGNPDVCIASAVDRAAQDAASVGAMGTGFWRVL